MSEQSSGLKGKCVDLQFYNLPRNNNNNNNNNNILKQPFLSCLEQTRNRKRKQKMEVVKIKRNKELSTKCSLK